MAHAAAPGAAHGGRRDTGAYTAGWLIHDAGFDPVMVGPLSTARLFQPGGPAFEAQMNATDLRHLLGVTANNPVDRALATQFAGGM